MSLTVTAAIHQAQQSLDRGEYPQAATLCDRLVTQFPGYARAWTLLGEAFREQGHNADAQRAYQAAVMRDLRSPLPYQGLGLLAEEQGNVDGALAYCQVGWELSPADQGMREPLMRVAMRRYATDGELQYTLPALAQQHLRSSRLRRALRVWRAAHAQLPERADVIAGLALTLWRLGHDTEAATYCEQILDRFPESGESLAILADVAERAGEQARARELVERLRAVDPDGAIAARLCALHPGANAALLRVPDARLPLVDESIHGTVAERPRLAPAPDVDYVPARADAELAQLEAMRLGDYSGITDSLPEPTFDPFAGALGVELPPVQSAAQGEPPSLPEGLQPMSLEEFGAQPGEALPTYAPEHLLAAADMEVGLDASGGWEAPAPAQPSAPPTQPAMPEPVDWQSALRREDEALQPVADADLFGDLAAELRDEVGDALTRSGQVEPIDDHRPPADDPRGFTTVLRSLDDEGIAPFDPRSREPIADMPSMLMNDDEISNAIPSGEPVTDRLGEISHDWESIDAEIQAAMPAGYAPGYTDELRALDQIGLMPFEVELGEPGGEADDDAPRTLDDILLQERGAGTVAPAPTPTVAPSAFATEPAVPSGPGAADLPAAAADAVDAVQAQEQVQAHGQGFSEFDDLLGGLQPFAAEEFDQDMPLPVSPTQSFTFSQGAWDAAIGGASAVPSDADLEALLSDDGSATADANADADLEPPMASLTNELMERQIADTAALAPADDLAALAAAEAPDQAFADLESEWEASGLIEPVAAEAGDEDEYIERDPTGTEQLAAELDLLEALEREAAELEAAEQASADVQPALADTTDAVQGDEPWFTFADVPDAAPATAAASEEDADLAALLEDDIVTAELGVSPLDPDPDMLERARDAKRSLIDTGVISGVREFDDFDLDAPTVMLGEQARADALAEAFADASEDADNATPADAEVAASVEDVAQAQDVDVDVLATDASAESTLAEEALPDDLQVLDLQPEDALPGEDALPEDLQVLDLQPEDALPADAPTAEAFDTLDTLGEQPAADAATASDADTFDFAAEVAQINSVAADDERALDAEQPVDDLDAAVQSLAAVEPDTADLAAQAPDAPAPTEEQAPDLWQELDALVEEATVDEATAEAEAPQPSLDVTDAPMAEAPAADILLDEVSADDSAHAAAAEDVAAVDAAEDIALDDVTLDDVALDEVALDDVALDDVRPMFAPVADEDDDEDVDIIHGIGATRDTTTLRAALGITPDDAELHWWLAEALRERGEVLQALDEYRWLIHNAPERQDAVLQSLLASVERQQELERVHRLVGDIYRRRGDTSRASHHASQALMARRRAHQSAR